MYTRAVGYSAASELLKGGSARARSSGFLRPNFWKQYIK